MGTITVWGESDDLIEVTGDVPDEEFNDAQFYDVGGVVTVSTGDQLVVVMDGTGAWQVHHTMQVTGSTLTLIPRPENDAGEQGEFGDQGGTLTTVDPIAWVECVRLGTTDLVSPGRVYAPGAAPDTIQSDQSQPLP